MRKTLTDKGVVALKPRAERFAFPDPEMTGHYVRVQPSGAKAYVTVARTPAGKQVWTSVGAADVMPIAEAREAAREIIKRVRAGLPAVESAPESVASVVENWIRRHVEVDGMQHLPIDDPARYRLRSQREIRRLLAQHILPAWRDREFASIGRGDITKLMDAVEDKHGARAADYCLNIFSAIAGWHAKRVDAYKSPVIRGMKRQSLKDQARARILDDAELMAIWKAAESAGAFGAIVQLLLLTAQRRTKIAEMKWSEISSAGEWTIPKEPREKDNAGVLLLPEMALRIIRAQPHMASNPHVFPGRRTDGPFKGFGEGKIALDAKLPADMPGWTLHDLRRTARSLMSRAGVRPDVAERVLGHAIAGVGGVYDRHQYRAEKAASLARLAALVGGIVHPRDQNVVPMVKPKRRRR